ncbi:MAG TPA: hypothetical protein VIV27_08705 [Halioglobus sp.]
MVEAKPLYRYRNAQGNVVVGYQVPVDAVAGGYEILNDKGMVTQVVPRALTEEERKAKDAEKKRDEEALAEQERLRKWDESLMLRYSTVADIEDAGHRALGDLQIRLSILKGNRRSLKQRVENYQAEAADTERAGRNVDVERLRTIETLQDEIATTEKDIVDRQKEMDILEASFAADIERFKMLQDVVELRQRLSAKSAKTSEEPITP